MSHSVSTTRELDALINDWIEQANSEDRDAAKLTQLLDDPPFELFEIVTPIAPFESSLNRLGYALVLEGHDDRGRAKYWMRRLKS